MKLDRGVVLGLLSKIEAGRQTNDDASLELEQSQLKVGDVHRERRAIDARSDLASGFDR